MQVYKVTSTGVILSSKCYIQGVTIVAASANSSIVLNDSIDGTGTDKGGAKAIATESRDSNLHNAEFATGLYATISGSGAVAYIYVE